MAEVLDQSEVDALLAAVEEVEASPDEMDGQQTIFSNRPEGLPSDIEVRDYDFKRPERVSKDQMMALQTLHEAFARGFGASLSGFLRTIVETKVATIDQMTFSEFTHSLPNPTCFNLLSCHPLDGNMCFEISPLIVYPIIDRLLGGSNADLFIPQRPLTAIEQRLVNKVIQRAMAALADAWDGIVSINFELQETESNPALVQIVAPNEVVAVVGFELKMGGRAGTMALCIPYKVMEPVVHKLSNQTWASYKNKAGLGHLRKRLVGQLESAKVNVAAELAHTTITLRELKNLEVGDVILSEKAAKSPLVLRVEDRRKFIGHLGQHRGNRAFKIARPIGPKDRV